MTLVDYIIHLWTELTTLSYNQKIQTARYTQRDLWDNGAIQGQWNESSGIGNTFRSILKHKFLKSYDNQ